MASLFARLASTFREFGAVAGSVYAADRIMRRLHPRFGLVLYDLMAQPVTDRPLLPTRLARHLSYRELSQDSLEVAAMPARADIKKQRFEQGAVALGVFRKEELIGYVWFCRGRYVEDEVRCIYEMTRPERSVFDFDLVVLPGARMGLGFGALWHCANQYLTAQGVATSYSRVTRFNVASMRAHQRLGARRLGSALFLQIGAFEAMFATVPPCWSAGAANRPPRFLLDRLPVAMAADD